MKKVSVAMIVFLAVLVALITGATTTLWWAFGVRSGDFYYSHVSVEEGFVDVYKYTLQGGRELFKTIYAGESVDVNGRVQKLSPVFEVIKSLIPSALQVVAEDCKGRAAYIDRSQEASYLYEQKELNERVIWKLNGRGGLSELQMTITEKGVEATAKISRLGVTVHVSGAGIVQADPSGRGDMSLKVQWVKIGSLPLPKPLLRGLEAAFSESLYERPFPIQVTRIEYQPGNIRVLFQGLADLGTAEKQVTHSKI